MNFKDSYKKDNEDINVRKEVLLKLQNDIKGYNQINTKNKENINNEVSKNNKVKINYRNKFNFKMGFSIVTALLVFSVIMFAKERLADKNNLENNISSNEIGSQSTEENNNSSNKETGDSNIAESEINEHIKDGIYVPKQQFGKINPNSQAYRNGSLVYKGRIYSVEGTEISLEEGKVLMDKKIGVTWDLIEELRNNMGEPVTGTETVYVELEKLEDFASLRSLDEVYIVKGYDENFRLITYTKNEYGEFISLWECLNDFILADGSDVFGKMNVKDNLESVTWKTFNNWNYGNKEENEITIDETLNNFINALYKGVPYSLEDKELRKSLFDKESNYTTGEEYFESNEERQKFVYLKLKDGTKIQLRLFKDGYVYYSSGLNFAFKLDEEVFDNIWNKLN